MNVKLYFRIKDNGATVFRIEENTRERRTEMVALAEANARNGQVRLRAGVELSDAEKGEIETWIAARRATLAGREARVPEDAIEAMNAAAHWISGQPDSAIADAATEDMLLAIMDLRAAIVRYRSKG